MTKATRGMSRPWVRGKAPPTDYAHLAARAMRQAFAAKATYPGAGNRKARRAEKAKVK